MVVKRLEYGQMNFEQRISPL